MKIKKLFKRGIFFILIPVVTYFILVHWQKRLDVFLFIIIPYWLCLLLFLLRNKIKLKKKRTGEYLTLSDFFKQVKKGMKEMTPLQQAQSTQFGQIVSMVGVVWGIIYSIIIQSWWMATILVGGLIVLLTQMIGNWQRKSLFLEQEKLYNLLDDVPKEDERRKE